MDTMYDIKFQCDFKWELKEDRYTPTRTDIKTGLLESVQGLTKYYDQLTGANRDAQIIAKAVVDKLPAWYVATLTLWVDGTKYEIPAKIDTDTPEDNPMAMIAELIKKITNGIRHIKR